jgi:hypothetical protein
MKRVLLGAGALALAGCASTGPQPVNVAAKVNGALANAPLACQDLAMLGNDVATIAGQVAAANPNNAKVQAVAAKAGNGVALSNADCQTLAGVAPATSSAVAAWAHAITAIGASFSAPAKQ